MKKLFYFIGLPLCFVVLVASTFLIKKTYESKFVIAVETQLSVEQNRVMTLNKPENYDLGVIRTDNILDRYTYQEIIRSDNFVRALLSTNVRTLKGDWDGTYYAYCTEYMQKDPKEAEKVYEGMPWTSVEEEAVAKALKKSINVEVDYESRLVTITCKTNDPLVSTMLATGIKEHLEAYIADYEQEKMAVALNQLHALTEAAKAEWENEKTPEKEQIYKSFARQEIVYQAQMMYVPAFSIVSEPSFSYLKVAPSRWKMPLLITLLLGIGFWCWDNKKMVKQYLLG